MIRSRSAISAALAAIALTSMALASGLDPAPAFPAIPPETSQSNQQAPPSDEEIRDRAAKVVANQHHEDEAGEQYEHIERHVDRTAGNNPRVLEDKTYRVVPTGLGTMKLLLKDGEKPADPAHYAT